MKLLKYSLSLSALFLIIAIVPGIVCVLCGFESVWASSGISLAVVCLLKGKIAQKIFGPNTTHHSSPKTAIVLMIISLISGVAHAYTYYENKEFMEKMGYVYDTSTEALIQNALVPIIISSLFWAIIVGIVTYIRGRQDKHQIISLDSETRDTSAEIGDVNENSTIFEAEDNDNYDSCSHDIPSESAEHKQQVVETKIDEQSSTPMQSADDAQNTEEKNICDKTDNHGCQKSSKLPLKTIAIASSIIVVILLCILIIPHIGSSKYKIGDYIYADSRFTIHTDINCEFIPDPNPKRILYANFNPTEGYNLCRKCVPDYIYQQMLEECEINIKISRVYSELKSKFTENVFSVLFNSPESFNTYIKNGDLWALHRLYSVNAVRPNNKEFGTFEELLQYFDRNDLLDSIPNLYKGIKTEDKKLYIRVYQSFIQYYTNYEYMEETESEYVDNAQEYPGRRKFMYEVCRKYMKVDSYENFESTILF
jgi:hypothetical protein